MCFNNEVIERIFMEDFMMTTRVDIDEHASLLHRSSYYLPLPQEDRQKKRSIKPRAVGFALLLLSCWWPMCVHNSQCKLFQRQFHRLFLWERRGVSIFRSLLHSLFPQSSPSWHCRKFQIFLDIKPSYISWNFFPPIGLWWFFCLYPWPDTSSSLYLPNPSIPGWYWWVWLLSIF